MSGAEALAAGDWEGARAAFERELASRETAELHDGLGRALWWLGRPDDAIVHRERAFVSFKERGENERAGATAVWLAREHLAVYGNDAVAGGWLARAERLIGDSRGSARGHLELARGRRAGEPADREVRASSALEIATSTGDTDLEMAALAESGLAAIKQGRVLEGLDRLDEAMAAATGGEADLLETVAEVCCSLVSACEIAGDSGRLEQWARIVAGFVDRRGDLPLLSFCRTCNAEMLAATGHREEAERELIASAASLGAGGHRSRCVDPAVKLAEVRVLQGRWEEASALLEGREDLPESTLPASEVDLARGDTALATARLLRRANLLGRDNLLSAPLLSLLVDARLAAGDLEEARATAAELGALAEQTGHPLLVAYARSAAGRLAEARGEPAAADLEAAMDRFTKLDQPLEAARAGLGVARAMAAVEPEVALDHAEAALAAFGSIGATRDADRAAALVAASVDPPAPAPRTRACLPCARPRSCICWPKGSPTPRSRPGCSSRRRPPGIT